VKVIRLSTEGIETPYAGLEPGGRFFVLRHGESGRGRWELRLPLAAREFPPSLAEGGFLPMEGEFKLIPLHREDPRGNPLFLLARGEEDGHWLVLWNLSPGYRGGLNTGSKERPGSWASDTRPRGRQGEWAGRPAP